MLGAIFVVLTGTVILLSAFFSPLVLHPENPAYNGMFFLGALVVGIFGVMTIMIGIGLIESAQQLNAKKVEQEGENK